jgi:hypothetical protein
MQLSFDSASDLPVTSLSPSFSRPVPLPIHVVLVPGALFEVDIQPYEPLGIALGQEVETELVYYCEVDSRREYLPLSPVPLSQGIE